MWDVVMSALTVSFLWGTSSSIHKVLFNKTQVRPSTLLVYGSLIYFICTSIYFYFYRDIVLTDFKRLPKKALLVMTLSGIIAGFLANYLYFHVVQKHASYVVSALIFSSPFFTFVISYLFLKRI